MPAKAIALPGGGYKVRTPKGVHAKHTSKKNALAQVRLLNALEHDPDFKMRKKK
jgi:hypothetical protein